MQISGHGKVDHLAKLLLGVQDTEGTGNRQAAARTQVGKDEVQISAQAKELQRIRELANQPDPERAEQVERIRRALDSGTYDISGRAVGDAIVKQVLTDAVL
ncbi:MAG: flagellar biosynthesis anti-sigma factor FlgM [Nitrospira sp.]|jgi:negative regulator of flagellin synthesis FlgM|nr:flagellar biosynthesis anti-sigma factor FlgM [Nitrospira sp.]MDH4249823.1 flagellar biosynthesis anti-sigma factor FlgM [Nitrospira sp.]MDH4342004.1 flagellar biosynthesis anti-sigma factor FlgM [Nitrospira sp.]MDH5334715.1 flagellar biosynthesis anti-sigma factor FlgM [Nitrospira sp.]TKB79055.1 MAG: flagellar biosynthesis anti-sigma factor FlgM [Nitrospira sp.]